MTNLKLENINLLEAMQRIADIFMAEFKTDFDDDVRVLKEAAADEESPKTYIWLCRKTGTWLLNETNVFLKDTPQYNTFMFYIEQGLKDTARCFTVEITGLDGENVIGNLYFHDYRKYADFVRPRSMTVATTTIACENSFFCGSGVVETVPHELLKWHPKKIVSWTYLPSEEGLFEFTLREAKKARQKYKTSDIDTICKNIVK